MASNRRPFMPPLARRPAIAVLIGLLILCLGAAPSKALDLPGLPWGSRAASGNDKPVPVEGPSGRLQEVAAPGGVDQLRNRLARHQPLVELQSPKDGSVLGPKDTSLTVSIKDWPLVADADLGLGPHLALQIDDQPPLRFSSGNQGADGIATLSIPLPALAPGSHRFTAYAAYPWGEAVKSPGASQQWRLHQLQELKGTQPERDAPWLVMVSPAELGGSDPLLLDWLVWNAPLQNLRDGDGRWRLRLTLNGDSFLVDRQDAIWLRQGSTNPSNALKANTVQMELLDGLGDPIDPAFNNQLRALPPRATSRPVWMQGRLNDNDLARLVGEPQTPSAPAPEPATDAAKQPAAEQPDTEQPAEAPQAKPQTPLTPSKPDPASTPLAQPEQADHSAPATVKADPNKTGSQRDQVSTKEPELKPSSRGADDTSLDSDTPENNPSNNTGSENATSANANAPRNPSAQNKPEQATPAPPTEAKSTPAAKSPSLPPSGEERLAPTTSLGGSARELVKPDGTKR
jgi:hypothetical protein